MIQLIGKYYLKDTIVQGVCWEMVGVTNTMKKGTSVPAVLNQADQDHHNALDQRKGSGCS